MDFCGVKRLRGSFSLAERNTSFRGNLLEIVKCGHCEFVQWGWAPINVAFESLGVWSWASCLPCSGLHLSICKVGIASTLQGYGEESWVVADIHDSKWAHHYYLMSGRKLCQSWKAFILELVEWLCLFRVLLKSVPSQALGNTCGYTLQGLGPQHQACFSSSFLVRKICTCPGLSGKKPRVLIYWLWRPRLDDHSE